MGNNRNLVQSAFAQIYIFSASMSVAMAQDGDRALGMPAGSPGGATGSPATPDDLLSNLPFFAKPEAIILLVGAFFGLAIGIRVLLQGDRAALAFMKAVRDTTSVIIKNSILFLFDRENTVFSKVIHTIEIEAAVKFNSVAPVVPFPGFAFKDALAKISSVRIGKGKVVSGDFKISMIANRLVGIVKNECVHFDTS